MNELGKRLRLLRDRAKLTQEELAHKCGYPTQSRIANYESGERHPRAKDLQLLAAGLGVSVADLVDDTEPAQTPDFNTEVGVVMRELVRLLVANMPGAARQFAALVRRQAKHNNLPLDADLIAQVLSIVQQGPDSAAAAIASAEPPDSVRRPKPGRKGPLR